VIIVADSSPLIILAKLGCFDLLRELFPVLHISVEVHHELVIAGAGLPGSSEVAAAPWITVTKLRYPTRLLAVRERYAMGAGELSTILLGGELRADAVLLDDYKARQLARAEGLQVRGTVGVLENLHRAGHLDDLRSAFRQLLAHNVYIDQRLLNLRLRALGIPPL
jgi:predicted nucleic acid-binding protein